MDAKVKSGRKLKLFDRIQCDQIAAYNGRVYSVKKLKISSRGLDS